MTCDPVSVPVTVAAVCAVGVAAATLLRRRMWANATESHPTAHPVTRVVLPQHGKRREQVGGLGLPADLTGRLVIVDASNVVDATSAYLDALVKTVLVDRGADRLTILGMADPRLRAFVASAALLRDVRRGVTFVLGEYDQ